MAGDSQSLLPQAVEDYSGIPFARGGPIYVTDLVGPLTSIPDFRANLLNELSSLQSELSITEYEEEDHDLSVDDLRVLTEEELVEKALQEETQDTQAVGDNSWGFKNGEMLEHSDALGKETLCLESPAIGNAPGSCTSMNPSSNADSSGKDFLPKKKGKRGRHFDRNSRAAELEGSYFAKVKELAVLKQKQDEDKLAARLHSFSGGNSKSFDSTMPASEKFGRMTSLRFISSPFKVKPSTIKEQIPVSCQEVVLCVEIYDRSNISKKTQEFLVLGSQLLTELRDNIYCLTDKLMQAAEEHDPSGYFLIEDKFYNDLRHPSATNYTIPIFDWLRNCKNEVAEKWEFVISGELKKKQKKLLGDAEISSLPDFKSAAMQKTHFSDLRFRLGAGYLYCHQGNCKHIIVIRDMRLFHPEDSQNWADYPLLTFQLRSRSRKCSVCKIYHATKMTVDDKWAPKNPCNFCIKCYYLLHYKEDNSLLYPHVVYDFFQE